jgi:recombination protein RecA
VVEVYGSESAGKTTLCLSAVANAQKQGLGVLYVDAEHALDPQYARNLGVKLDKMLFSQPDSAEQALDFVLEAVTSGAVGLVVVDSVAALTPQAELDGEMGDQQMGLQARLMGKALRKICAVVSRTNTLVIFVNQTRQKIGVVYGSPITTPGGNALRFYASVRVDLARQESLKQGEKVVGSKVRAKVVKNKMAPPFRTAVYEIAFGRGINAEAELYDAVFDTGQIARAGAWITFETWKFQGREAFLAAIRDDKNLRTRLEELAKNVSQDDDQASSEDVSLG